MTGSRDSFPEVVLTLVRVLAEGKGSRDTRSLPALGRPRPQGIPATPNKGNEEPQASLGSEPHRGHQPLLWEEGISCPLEPHLLGEAVEA